ncbi:hypothetical protein HRbin06_00979 [archaeon HR06]|nr:hypothetical protein HRbin06_00979 [archaeon HR06]
MGLVYLSLGLKLFKIFERRAKINGELSKF